MNVFQQLINKLSPRPKLEHAHQWTKIGGPYRIGDRFEQKLICQGCGAMKYHQS